MLTGFIVCVVAGMPLGAQDVPLDKEAYLVPPKAIADVVRAERDNVALTNLSPDGKNFLIVKTDGLLLLRDLGSTNGTRVNGQRIRRAALLPNDHLNIASLRFKVEFSSAEEAPVGPDEFTQQMDAKDVQRMLKKRNAALEDDSDEDSVEDVNLPPLQANALPDVIEEKEKEKAGKKK